MYQRMLSYDYPISIEQPAHCRYFPAGSPAILFEERGYEFMDEMQRWFDILRFDKGTEILGNKGWTEKFRYFPIDQSEMDRAKGGLTQNPGWL